MTEDISDNTIDAHPFTLDTFFTQNFFDFSHRDIENETRREKKYCNGKKSNRVFSLQK